jgi:Tfp pilus assembly protein PilZ
MSEHRKEERKEERKGLITFTPAYDLRKNVLLGYLGDLTLQGAMVVGYKPMEIDEKLTLAIEFHETPEIPATRMTIPARVAWCKHEEHSNYYNTGVEFLKLTKQNKTVIVAILERYQFRKGPPT